jgi:ATP-dependent Clp protease protease subunit
MKKVFWLVLALLLVFSLWLLCFNKIDRLFHQIDKSKTGAEPISIPVTPVPDSVTSQTDTSKKIVDNQIKIFSNITEDVALEVITEMHQMEKDSNIQEIEILIDSRGGTTISTFWICYAMKLCRKPIRTIAVGNTLSGAAIILSCGTKYKRFAMPGVQIMLHRPWTWIFQKEMRAEDLEREAYFMRLTEQLLYELISENTGRSIEQIKIDLQKELYLTPQEAIQYGLIDSLYQK